MLTTLALLSLFAVPEAAPRVIALKAARLWDGRHESVVTPGVVVVTGGTITAAGAKVVVPGGRR